MGLYTGAIKGISKAPFRTQVLVELMRLSGNMDFKLTKKEEVKIERVKRFLPADRCADEIIEERQRKGAV